MSKTWVVLGNFAICSMVAAVACQAWRDGAPELAVIGGAIVCVVLVAIYNTITGREE